jgi:cytochrome c biogenesis protein CcdA
MARSRAMPIPILLPLLGLAVVDSINPSALLVTFVLLTRPRPVSRVLTYLAGVFVSYLAIGIGLIVGLDAALATFGDALEGPIARGVQLAIGAAMLAYAIVAPSRPRDDPRVRVPAALPLRGLLGLGIGVTFLELPTALPYFAAIALLTAADLPVLGWLPLLALYNVVFVLPPLAILLTHRLVRDRLPGWEERLRRGGRETLLWLIGIVGFLVTADAVAYFVGVS